ncbi:MAG: HAD family hydrolase [Candidatus Njordarchaeum guaymaensis]
MIQAVLFDMGGVLAKICWDVKEIARLARIGLEEKGLLIPIDFESILDEELYDAWLRVRKTLREENFAYIIRKTLDRLGLTYDEDAISNAVNLIERGDFCHVSKDAEKILKQIKQMGLKIGLISNAPGIFPINVLKRNGLDKYMDVMVTSYQVGVVKPHPKIFLYALNKLNVKPTETVFVGDTPEIDIRGAKNLGMITIWVKDGDPVMRERGMLELPKDLKPDYIVNDVSEILDIIKNLIDRK